MKYKFSRHPDALGLAQMIAALAIGTASLALGAADGSEDRVPPMPQLRVPQTEMGITQLPNEKLDWLLDAKFGMFIHWGLYSGLAQGEWAMEKKGFRQTHIASWHTRQAVSTTFPPTNTIPKSGRRG